MNEFEIQSLEIARQSFYANIGSDIIAAVALAAAIVGAIAAFRGIRGAVDQLEVAKWNSLLSFEQDMAHRRSRFADIAAQLASTAPTPTLAAMYDEAKESYFNSLDRLSSSILIGHFPDKEMKQDYEGTITRVVQGFPADFQTGTPYRKIVKLYNKWIDQ